MKYLLGDTVEYFSPQHDGPVNYKLHDLYKDGIRIENKSAISFQVKVIYYTV